MSKLSTDLPTFLSAIDAISERLEPPRRSQDANAPDCSIRELSALQAIRKHGRINMSDLAAIIDVPVSTATRLVDQLVSKKLLTRQTSLQDARKVEVDFSSLGDEINAYINQARQAHALSMLNVLSAEERASFLAQLSRLLAAPL